MFLDRKIQTHKAVNSLNLIYTFKAIPIRIPIGFSSYRTWQADSKIHVKEQRAKLHKIFLRK